MGFGISVKVMPGVRIRASSRGLRASVGPRVARVHVGAGRTSVSSGVGPFTVSSGGGRRRTRTGARRQGVPTLAQLERQAKAAQRDEEIARLDAVERDLTTLHLDQFEPATRPIAPEPPPIDEGTILRAHEAQERRGLSVFARRDRRAARERAAAAAREEIAREAAARTAARDGAQAALDAGWRALNSHQPEAVLAALEVAFEDNQSPATCIDVDIEGGRRHATVVVLFGDVDQVPDRAPAVTPTGRPTIRARTKTARNELYVRAMGSAVLATVKEGFAVAPSVEEFRVVVIAQGHGVASLVYVGEFARSSTAALRWHDLDPEQVLMAADGARLRRQGQARSVAPLDLSDDPGSLALLAEVAGALGCQPPPAQRDRTARPRHAATAPPSGRPTTPDARHRRPE